MSFLESWSFRSATPSFEPGDRIRAIITDFNSQEGMGVARIGDTIIRVDNTTRDDLDREVGIEIEQFDRKRSRGEGRRLEIDN